MELLKRADDLLAFHASEASSLGAAAGGTTMSSTTCGTALQSLRTQMPSANSSAASDCGTAGR